MYSGAASSSAPSTTEFTIKLPARAMFAGKTGSGKTKLCLNITQTYHRSFKQIIVLCPEKASAGDWANCGFINPKFVWTEFTNADIKGVYDKLSDYKQKKGKTYETLIIFDDCLQALQTTKREEAAVWKQLFCNGRHVGISIFFCTQYIKALPIYTRGQFGYVFCGRVNGSEYDAFLREYRPTGVTKKELEAIYTEVTKVNYRFLIVDTLESKFLQMQASKII
jgi:energy-coupling factor transporter ATP-binding protein EcfA2